MSSIKAPPPGALLGAIGGIYVTQSLVTGIAMLSMPTLLHASGASLQWAGLAALFMLPWGLKFLWAPAVERWRLPGGGAPPRSRRLILRGQWLLAACLLGAALAGLIAPRGDPAGSPAGLMLALWFAACLTATIDIACDGFAVDRLASRHRGWGNVAQVGGSYLGIALGGSAFLLAAQAAGWPAAMAGAGALVLLLTVPLWRLRIVGEAPLAHHDKRQRPSLRHALAAPPVRRGLLLTCCCTTGVRLAAAMGGPLLLDRGASLALVGMLNGLLGIGCGLAGTLAGGLLVQRAGAARAVLVAVGLQALVLATLALASGPAGIGTLAALLGLKLAAMACGFVAIYALLMGWASPRQAGVDFTLFQCADALVAALAGALGGWLAQHWGYAACFGIAAALSTAAAGCAARLLRPVLRRPHPLQDAPHTP